MYIPAAFAETDLVKLHEFIERHSFWLLITQQGEAPFASHLPFLLERTTGASGELYGHMARANPQWEHAAGQRVLAVFSGPHAYISPSWYESEQVVPTWNYTAVHVSGPLEIVHDESALLEIVHKSVAYYEAAMPRPWSFDVSSVFVKRLLSQIVGFRIKIESIEGKWKLNQNHGEGRRQKVVHALESRDDENARAVAALMRAMLPAQE